MAERLASCPDHLHVQLPVNPTDVVIQRLEAETDEMWGFVGKKVNKTKLLRSRPVRRHVEHFNNALRQCFSRLVCETLLFSKKLANHSGAIKFFICNYNLARTVALPVQHCPGISDLDRDSLTLKSEGLPSGRYTGHLSLTEPNTCRAIAQPRASFLLETWEQAHENQ